MGQNFLDSQKMYMRLYGISNDRTYGFYETNPVYTGHFSEAYINALKTKDGGSLAIVSEENIYSKKNHQLKKLIVRYPLLTGFDTMVIYVDTSYFKQPLALKGFDYRLAIEIPKSSVKIQKQFSEQNKANTDMNIDDYGRFECVNPDTLDKIAPCMDTVYCPDNRFIKTKGIYYYQPKPEKIPEYLLEIDSLKSIINEELATGRAKIKYFEIMMAFLVTCEGMTGKYDILYLVPHGRYVTCQFMEMFRRLPQNWQPAINGSRNVDCYQLISLKIKDGEVEKLRFIDQ